HLFTFRCFYDQNGGLVRTMNGNGQSLVMRRYPDGRLKEVDDPDGKNTVRLEYATGSFRPSQVTVLTPAGGATVKASTTLDYDALGRLIRTTRNGESGDSRHDRAIQVYDAMGQLVELGREAFDGDWASVPSYNRGWKRSFDARGRLEWWR